MCYEITDLGRFLSSTFLHWFRSMDSMVGRLSISVQHGLDRSFLIWWLGNQFLNFPPKCTNCITILLVNAIRWKFWKMLILTSEWLRMRKDLLCCGLMFVWSWIRDHYLLFLGGINDPFLFGVSWFVAWTWLLLLAWWWYQMLLSISEISSG